MSRPKKIYGHKWLAMMRTNIVLIKLRTKEEFVTKAPVLPHGNMANGPSVQRLVVSENEAKWDFVGKMANRALDAMNLNVSLKKTAINMHAQFGR